MTEQHDDRVRQQFAHQAQTFTNTGFAVRGLEWIVDTIRPEQSDTVLDVACGAAHLARALAPHVAHVAGIDLTPEMLAQADRLARESGIDNLTLQQGDATRLPWLDAQFDLVVCRFTLHQVSDPAAVVREMVRVTKPTGTIAIVDMIADADPNVAAETNRLERLRDPSHNTTLTEPGIRALLHDAGAEVLDSTTKDQPLDLLDWMRRTQTPPGVQDEIVQRLTAELDRNAPPSGLLPHHAAGGSLAITHPIAVVTARPPDRS